MNYVKYLTDQQAQSLLDSLENDGHPGYIQMTITALLHNQFNSEYWKNVSSTMKDELTKAVLRYVTRNALKGTTEADGLANSCGFAGPVPFGNPFEFTFTVPTNKQRIHAEVDIENASVHYFYRRNEVCIMPLPEGFLPNLDGQLEIVRQFEQRNRAGSGLWIGERPKNWNG